ncbi:MAG: methyltransferase [Robiginitomaculum sp.]|nr:MAG: methyltransferase [Robiginitomaculum sp.]
MKNLFLITTAIAALTLNACDTTDESHAQTAKPVAEHTKVSKVKTKTQRDIGNRGEVMMAIQHLDRTQKDKENDSVRKAAAVLQFANIWPGMTVVEMEAGGGYYTDILSKLVGADGKVIMQNPASFDNFIPKEKMEARLAPLANVRLSKTNFDALDVPSQSADVVTWILGPHELFYTPEGGSSLGDADKTYAEIFRVLKPGGHFIVLDHVASAGTPESSGGDTHRIDPATVRARVEKAGLVFVEESTIHKNVTDDHTTNVFDPVIRRKTDRFLHKYTKPK